MKTKEEFNLSEEIIHSEFLEDIDEDIIEVQDVREFIRRLKEFVYKNINFQHSREWEKFEVELNKLAGEKLK